MILHVRESRHFWHLWNILAGMAKNALEEFNIEAFERKEHFGETILPWNGVQAWIIQCVIAEWHNFWQDVS